MATKLVGRALAILPKLKEVYKNDKERTETISEYAQFFIERFNESIKVSEKQVETDIVLLALENVRVINELQKQSHCKELDTNVFYDKSLHLLEERIDKLKPETFLKSLEKFDDHKHKARLVNALLKGMKENKVDIRKYNFAQIT